MDATAFDNRGSNANQVPQAFGASNSDGSPLTSSSHPGTAFAEDNNDAKRRRIARVCRLPYHSGLRDFRVNTHTVYL